MGSITPNYCYVIHHSYDVKNSETKFQKPAANYYTFEFTK